MMRVLAISCMPFDIEICCFGTLLKFRRQGANVVLILVTAKGWTAEERSASIKRAMSSGLETIEINNFDYKSVTQEDVRQLESCVKKIGPSIVFLPFRNSTNTHRRVAGSSAFLAARSCKNVLMYEPDAHNPSYTPNVYFPIGKSDARKKKSLVKEIPGMSKSKTVDPMKTISRNRTEADKSRLVEAFHPHRLILNGRVL